MEVLDKKKIVSKHILSSPPGLSICLSGWSHGSPRTKKLTVEPGGESLQLILSLRWLQTLPDGPYAIYPGVMQVEDWIAGGSELIDHQATDGLMARRMHALPSDVGDQIVVVGGLGEKVGDGLVGHALAAE